MAREETLPMLDTTRAEYITAAETARLVRAKLARTFPSVRFSVRTKTYSGGASINVSYPGITGYETEWSCCPMPSGLRVPGDWCAKCGSQPRWRAIYNPGMPNVEDVKDAVGPYAGSGFDGMIDLAYGKAIYLDAVGNVIGGRSRGTTDSHGCHTAYDDTANVAAIAARYVRPGADYIFVDATS
jgi:hypothetical protein